MYKFTVEFKTLEELQNFVNGKTVAVPSTVVEAAPKAPAKAKAKAEPAPMPVQTAAQAIPVAAPVAAPAAPVAAPAAVVFNRDAALSGVIAAINAASQRGVPGPEITQVVANVFNSCNIAPGKLSELADAQLNLIVPLLMEKLPTLGAAQQAPVSFI